MWQRFITVQSADPIQRTRGALLIGTAASLMIVAILYIPVALFIPPAWLVSALIVFAGICFGVILMAQRGHTAAGGTLLSVLMLILIPTATSADNLLQGPVGMVFLLPMLVIGMTVGAAGILGVGVASLAILLVVQLRTGAPWNERIAQLLLMLLLFGIVLWLIFQSMNRALRQAIQRTHEAETTRTLLEAREADLIQTRDALVHQNDDLHQLVALVQELEVPMIPVHEDIMVVPLVGYLDTRRAEHLTTRVLSMVSTQRIGTILIDITGVRALDTQAVRHLQSLVHGIRLLGATTVLTGMSPAVATMMVNLGIDLAWVQTAASVHEVITRQTSR
jgi:rsbT co-antagonist protein RsbR